MRRCLSIPLLLVLGSCGTRYSDTGEACVMPVAVECHYGGDSDTGVNVEECDLNLDCSCHGLYPADEFYEVHAWLSLSYGSDEVVFRVGDDELQEMACVTGGR
jgi:hypothetical protein